jgi:hypothetical protein
MGAGQQACNSQWQMPSAARQNPKAEHELAEATLVAAERRDHVQAQEDAEGQ